MTTSSLQPNRLTEKIENVDDQSGIAESHDASERQVIIDCTHKYSEAFLDLKIKANIVSGDNATATKKQKLAHCASYLPRIRALARANRVGDAKAMFRFVEGVLWSQGIFTLNELRKLNRSI